MRSASGEIKSAANSRLRLLVKADTNEQAQSRRSLTLQ
jgi:hypothetical protein